MEFTSSVTMFFETKSFIINCCHYNQSKDLEQISPLINHIEMEINVNNYETVTTWPPGTKPVESVEVNDTLSSHFTSISLLFYQKKSNPF